MSITYKWFGEKRGVGGGSAGLRGAAGRAREGEVHAEVQDLSRNTAVPAPLRNSRSTANADLILTETRGNGSR